jgi:hypothetical protein
MEEFRAKMLRKKESDFPETKQVAAAFLMISVEAGREKRIKEKLFAYIEMREIYLVPGDYDIIAKIVAKRATRLRARPLQAAELYEFEATVTNSQKPIIFIAYSLRGHQMVYEMANDSLRPRRSCQSHFERIVAGVRS